ncbi:helix-turn-helix domain-containing protein [Curtobacterium sp. SP.BCp]
MSEYLRVPIATLHDWRYRKVGPKAMMVGKSLRCRLSALNSWLDERAS